MVMISERPPAVKTGAVPRHWEGDLLIGTRTNAIATLVERQTRYCQLVALPEGSGAEAVCEALKQSIITLPAQLRRSLTTAFARQRSNQLGACETSGVGAVTG
jgi:transposase, IS30 family